MSRTKGSKNKRSQEFDFICSELERDNKYKNPIEILYVIANGRYNVSVKLQAVEQLLSYRYAKPASQPVEQKQGDMFKLVRENGEAVA